MTGVRHTLTLVSLSLATLAAALCGPALGSPDPVIMLTMMVSALIASIAGLAFSAIGGSILSHALDDPIRVLLLLTVCSLANQVVTVWSLRDSIDWRGLRYLVAGGMAGIAPGLWALIHVDHRIVARGIGIVLFAYAGNLVVGRLPLLTTRSRWADAGVGLVGGAIGVVAALPSLPVTVWCQARGLHKEALRATVQPFILAMQLVTLPFVVDAAPHAIGAADLLCIPASLLGTQIGLGCANGLSNRQFTVAVACLLSVCGVSFLV